ncbi:unnamed protein product, partial [Cuscuta epithymum]
MDIDASFYENDDWECDSMDQMKRKKTNKDHNEDGRKGLNSLNGVPRGRGRGQGLRSVLSHNTNMNGARAEDFRKGYQNTINSSNGAQKEPMHQRHENITSDSGDFTSHTVVLCFGEAEYREKNFSEDSCLLDILAMCHKLVDIYSVGIKITDGNGRPLKCDQDVANMLKEHQGLENIIINLYKDDTVQPLSYKLPQHN